MKLAAIIVFTYLICLFFTAPSKAEDIELYVNKDVNINEKPRVLLIFDTSGSMAYSTATGDDCGQYSNRDWILCSDSRLGVAKEAMTELVNNNKDIDFGLMRFSGLNGGYVLAGIGSTTEKITSEINKLPADGGTPLAETIWEAYLYITGQSLQYGQQVAESKRDTNIENKVFIGRERVRKCSSWWNCWWEWQDKFSYRYISPFADSSAEVERCDNSINIIYMTDGDPSVGDDNEMDENISTQHNNYFSRYLNTSDGINGNYLHQLAKVIHGTSSVAVDLIPTTTNIKETGRVYPIGFGSGMTVNGKKLLEETARLGGGQYLHANSADQLAAALKNTITLIREENSTFTSPSFASNNVDQTRSKDAVYLAMFYPEVGTRWRGNLKKIKVMGNKLIDSTSTLALNSDGLIKKDAKTFWTKGNLADGNSVESGGVNAMLTSLDPGKRKLISDIGVFNISNLVKVYGDKEKAAGVFNVSESVFDSTINWARGVDVDNENSTSTQRADIFGDPLHSKPVAIDYGNNDVRILIGTNAGFLHMFKDDDSKNEVTESWAFIPSALFNIIKPLRAKETGKKYGMDGPISVYSKNESLDEDGINDGIVNAGKGDTVWAFAGMRRGGRNYYGLDITKPDSPSLMWSIKGGVDSGFEELGQSWSKPQVAFIKAFGDKPVLIFGGGYDTIKDKDKGNKRDADSMGRDVFIVDAKTGKKLWSLRSNNSFTGKHSIAADVTLLDSNYDGYIDRIYAADTGGDIWRVDMPSSQTNEFSHFKLASLADGKDRRFFYKPAIARTIFSKVTQKEGVTSRVETPYDAIVIGSGNRTNPINSTTADELFMIRDENTLTKSFKSNAPETILFTDLMSMNEDKFGNALSNVSEFINLEVELTNTFKGWHYTLSPGEKSLAAATVVGGVAYFTSFSPASDTGLNQCSLTGGGGSLYAFHLHYGTKVYDELKFATSYEVPDTPQLYFGASCVDGNSDGKCDDDTTVDVQSQFYLIGPGIKGKNAENPFRPIEIIGPNLKIVDGKIQLVNDTQPIGFGFKTQQMYIYKREENDEVNN